MSNPENKKGSSNKISLKKATDAIIIHYRNKIGKMYGQTRLNVNREYLTEHEIEILIENTNKAQKIYISLSLFTGIRPNETTNLKWENIDFKNEQINLSSNNDNKPRLPIPIHKKIKTILLD